MSDKDQKTRIPQQKRSIKTKNRILVAAKDQFARRVSMVPTPKRSPPLMFPWVVFTPILRTRRPCLWIFSVSTSKRRWSAS